MYLPDSQSCTPMSTTTKCRLTARVSSTCHAKDTSTHMIDLYTGIDDIDVNATSSAIVVNVRIRQSKGIFRGHGFTVTDPLQAPRRVGPNSDMRTLILSSIERRK